MGILMKHVRDNGNPENVRVNWNRNENTYNLRRTRTGPPASQTKCYIIIGAIVRPENWKKHTIDGAIARPQNPEKTYNPWRSSGPASQKI